MAMNKEDMLALVRSVAVPDDVEQGMNHAYDLGVEWALAEAIKKVILEVDDPQASNTIKKIKEITP